MPFGLTNAPSVFMAAMNDVLQGLSFVSVYLDDILIFSKTPEEHITHVETVLNRIKEHGFFLKLFKCEFFQTSITYLGHLINYDDIMPDPKKLSAVKDWPTPKSILDVRSFLGLANYFRRYVKGFSEIFHKLDCEDKRMSTFLWHVEISVSWCSCTNDTWL